MKMAMEDSQHEAKIKLACEVNLAFVRAGIRPFEYVSLGSAINRNVVMINGLPVEEVASPSRIEFGDAPAWENPRRCNKAQMQLVVDGISALAVAGLSVSHTFIPFTQAVEVDEDHDHPLPLQGYRFRLDEVGIFDGYELDQDEPWLPFGEADRLARKLRRQHGDDDWMRFVRSRPFRSEAMPSSTMTAEVLAYDCGSDDISIVPPVPCRIVTSFKGGHAGQYHVKQLYNVKFGDWDWERIESR